MPNKKSSEFKVFHVKLSEYQYEKLVKESGHVHEQAEQIIREALAIRWKDATWSDFK